MIEAPLRPFMSWGVILAFWLGIVLSASAESAKANGLESCRESLASPVLLRKPNYAAAFRVWFEGQPRVLRLSATFDKDKLEVGRLFAEYGFGVPIIQSYENAALDDIINKFNLSEYQQELEDSLPSELDVEILDYVVGIEFSNGRIYKNELAIDPATLDHTSIKKQLLRLLAFCNERQIEIGSDFQFFITASSKVIIFDYDLYSIKVPNFNAIRNENKKIIENTLRQLSTLKQRTPLFKQIWKIKLMTPNKSN